MMTKLLSGAVKDRNLTVQVPDDWHVLDVAVPSLVYPRQLFAASTHRLFPVSPRSEQPRPRIQDLPPNAVAVWAYYQEEGDIEATNIVRPLYGPIPSDGLDVSRSETFSAHDAREWSGADFMWRRCGFEDGKISITLWIWEGTKARAENAAALREVIRSAAYS